MNTSGNSDKGPIERMNSLHPELRLVSLPADLAKVFGEPNVEICLEYYKRMYAAFDDDDTGAGAGPVELILDFLRNHPIEFQCSGWVISAIGYLVMGYPKLRFCEDRAKKLFSGYWRLSKSPKALKYLNRQLAMSKANGFLNSGHLEHWRRVARWMQKAENRSLERKGWLKHYTANHSHPCSCVTPKTFHNLQRALLKLSQRTTTYRPEPSAVALEAVAITYGIAARELAAFRADAKKQSTKKQ